jgi:hypothetical protein
MKTSRLIAASLAAIAAAGLAVPLTAQDGPDSGPVARYDMRAGTITGFGGMGQGGRGGMMSAIMGGGGGSQAQHELLLRLGSSDAPAGGKPQADHFMPAGAKLGKSVALVTPREERGPVDEVPDFSERGEKPSGRILFFWGCGEHAPAGQPYVLDLGKLSRGEIPAGESPWTTTILADWGPTLANSTTFGHWPGDDGKAVKPDSSLIGQHRVAGNYSPEIAFTLAKDFMAALGVSVTPQQSGARLLSWGTVPDATGLVATIIGSKQGPGGKMGDMVMWSSSASRQFGGGLGDWLTPAQAASLVRDRTLLAPATTECLVPAEVIAAAPDFRMGTLTAFGPEEDFSYPPRPTAANARWDLQWTARIRHRSMTNWMEAEGMTMGTAESSAMGQQAGRGEEGEQAKAPECKPKKRGFGGLGGALGGIMGGRAGRAAGNAAEDAATAPDCDDD